MLIVRSLPLQTQRAALLLVLRLGKGGCWSAEVGDYNSDYDNQQQRRDLPFRRRRRRRRCRPATLSQARLHFPAGILRIPVIPVPVT